MRYKLFFSFLFSIMVFFSCNDNKSDKKEIIEIEALNEKSIVKKHVKKNSFERIKVTSNYSKLLDDILKCDNYVYNDSYFRIPDYGCIYNPKLVKINKLGWADVLLLLKKQDEISYNDYSDDKIYKLEDELNNNLSFTTIKEKFIPIIFLIEYKYLFSNPNNEILFYPTLPYVKKLFTYDNKEQNWFLTDSIVVKQEIEDSKWVNESIDFIIVNRQR